MSCEGVRSSVNRIDSLPDRPGGGALESGASGGSAKNLVQTAQGEARWSGWSGLAFDSPASLLHHILRGGLWNEP